MSTELFQYFWRCEHHPSAMENFYNKLAGCERMCHATELQWWHRGAHPAPAPKPWGRVRIGV